tara:strand:+ start:131 stop:325 length:195 start_codon:yes stop_codon:yes gene_type:complete
MTIIITVKLGAKETEEGLVEVVGVVARESESGEIKVGEFSGTKEKIRGILEILESHPDVKIKYE